MFSGHFVRELVRTTALRPILGNHFGLGDSHYYDWWHPNRTLQMFDFLANPIEGDGPQFVFAHFLKPHLPATFDRLGNTFVSPNSHDGFGDDHDPSVPSAFVGQVMFINSKIIETVDAILSRDRGDAVIVISGDHGIRFRHADDHAILAAFRLPSGANDALYPAISSVNHFRVVLNTIFEPDIGLLEDRTYKYIDERVTEFFFEE